MKAVIGTLIVLAILGAAFFAWVGWRVDKLEREAGDAQDW